LNEAFATHAAAISQDCLARLGGIALAKTVLALASNLGWLIGAFHFLLLLY